MEEDPKKHINLHTAILISFHASTLETLTIQNEHSTGIQSTSPAIDN